MIMMMKKMLPPITLLVVLGRTFLVAEANLQFNYEVERRVYERIDDFMSAPKHAVDLMSRVHKNDYLNLLDYEDKDAFASLSYSLMNEFGSLDWVYYGTERGMCLAYVSENFCLYREPGDSYLLGSDSETEKLYHKACVNQTTGQPSDCTHQVIGAPYVSCIDGCSEYVLCPDEGTRSCTNSKDCGYQQKWCRDYEILKVQEGDPPRGFVPRTDYCITDQGELSEERGAVLQQDGTLGSCFFGDGKTRVQRGGGDQLAGNYEYCQKLQKRGLLPTSTTTTTNTTTTTTEEEDAAAVCNSVFAGGFRSRDYDPRYRPWYTSSKSKQRPNWSPPYTFFDRADLGITYCVPFYTKDENDDNHRRTLFAGVFAADYTFQNITNFLTASYPADDGTYVVIYEQDDPNYIVASSTGRDSFQTVLASDESTPCPDDDGGTTAAGNARGIQCTNIRDAMNNLRDGPFDDVLLAAYLAQEELGYPTGELVTSQTLEGGNGQAYVSQSSRFEDGEDLKWMILIISEVEKSDTDSLTKEQPLFAVVCLIAILGFASCLVMFIFMYLKRKTRAVILADWRFTLAFLLGCALLNLSSLTFLGENTEALCLTRMWSFHLLFAVTMSPLFVKVYRMYKLVGHEDQSPTVISNPRAVAMTMPIVAIQLVILIIFTILDPPVPVATTTIDDSVVSQSIECAQETKAFAFTVLAYEAALIFIGCVLSFMTRNLASNIGQSKELIFSMYNIAFVGVVTAVISAVTDIDAVGRAVFFSLGIFCGTVFSSVAFVLPRIYQEGQSLFHGMSKSFKASVTGKKSNDEKASGGKLNKSGGGSNDSPHQSQPKRKSGKSVSFGGDNILTNPPVTGWSAMEETAAENGDDEPSAYDVSGSGMMGSKTFSGKIGDDTTTNNSSIPPENSGWSVIEGGEEKEPRTGWSVAEEEEQQDPTRENKDERAGKLVTMASKRFSNSRASGLTTVPRVSGWSQFENSEYEAPTTPENKEERAMKIATMASKRFSNSRASGLTSVPRVSGWSEFENSEYEAPASNNAHAAKEFSDDEMEEEEEETPAMHPHHHHQQQPQQQQERNSGWSEMMQQGGGDKQQKQGNNDGNASKEFSGRSLNTKTNDEDVVAQHPPAPSCTTDVDMLSEELQNRKRASWWEGPQNDQLEALVSQLDIEDQSSSIEVVRGGGQGVKQSAGRPGTTSSSNEGIKDTTETTMETSSSRNASPVSI